MAKNQQPLVLVADDEPSTLALVSNHLESRGYRVVEAADGDEAWNAACRELPDVVVLDVMMPGMSGWEVCRKIREAVSLAHTGVVMLTGIGDTLNELTSPLYGADAYLDKPFQFTDLAEAVAKTLEQRAAGKLGRPGTTTGPEKKKKKKDTQDLDSEDFDMPAEKAEKPAKKSEKPAKKSAKKPAQPTKKAKTTKPIKKAKPAKAVKPVKKAKPAKAVKPAKPAKKAKPTKAAKPIKKAKPAKATKPIKKAKPAKAVKPAKKAKPAKAAKKADKKSAKKRPSKKKG
jgi:DNA-binding response OmpR family regulator